MFDPDGQDDFSTVEDDEGKAKLRQIEEEKKQRCPARIRVIRKAL